MHRARGGVTGTTVAAGRQACFKLSDSLFTPVQVKVDGTNVSGTWTVYAR